GEDLAVDVDVGSLEPCDEARVRDVVLPAGGVELNGPQAPELALPGAPAAVRVPQRAHDLLVRLAEPAALRAGVGRRLVEHRASVLLALNGTLYPRHRDFPPARGEVAPRYLGPPEQALDVLLVGAGHLRAPTEATCPAARLLLEQVR